MSDSFNTISLMIGSRTKLMIYTQHCMMTASHQLINYNHLNKNVV